MDSASRPPTDFALYLITDRGLIAPRDLAHVCDEILGAIASDRAPIRVALQLREKDLGGRELFQLAAALRSVCTRHRAPLVVHERIDVALAVGADGVHLPANSIAIADARRLLGRSKLIGVSTHSAAEVAEAAAAGADFAVFGPLWPTLSKPGYGPARGADSLAAACQAASAMPLYALGGVTAERVEAMGAPGGAAAAAGGGGRPALAGVAVIGSVFGADDPAAAALELARAVGRTFAPRSRSAR